MTIKWVFIEPVDVWLFRDGRPFSAGEGHAARSIFPPTPHTVQGALRSAVLGHESVPWQAYYAALTDQAQRLRGRIGGPSGKTNGTVVAAELGCFAMAGPFVALKEKGQFMPYFRLPSDVLAVKDTKDLVLLAPTEGLPFDADWPDPSLEPLWADCDQELESPEELDWVKAEGFDAYLQGDVSKLKGVPAEGVRVSEFRYGHQMDGDTRRPKEGMLYQAEFIRPQPTVGLLARVSDAATPPDEAGTLALGGEAKAARYRILGDKDVVPYPKPAQPDRRLKVVLLTPAYFSDGWRPAGGDWSALFAQKVKLCSVALNRPAHIGGWDVARRRSKPMRYLVPAGSVYFFEAEAPIQPPTYLTETPNGELDFAKLGFGQIACGTWKPRHYADKGGTDVH
jgi:CRISPR-associated protein Cmr3